MAKHKLLLADDSITIQKVVNLTFADEGIEVISVGDGNSALEKFSEFTPDLVMADINMPGLNGYEICERIKQNEQTRRIPVILLVGSFEPFDETEARRVGADDYLTKPFQSIRQLVNKVSTLLESINKSPNEEELAAAAAGSGSSISNSSNGEFDAPYSTSEDSYQEQTVSNDQLGDAGMDDEMIQTNAGGFSFDDTHKFTSKPAFEEDYANTQPLAAEPPDQSDLDKTEAYDTPRQFPEQFSQNEYPSVNQGEEQNSAGEVNSSADRDLYKFSENKTEELPRSLQNQFIYQNYQNNASAPPAPTSEWDLDEMNLLEVPPRKPLFKQPENAPVQEQAAVAPAAEWQEESREEPVSETTGADENVETGPVQETATPPVPAENHFSNGSVTEELSSAALEEPIAAVEEPPVDVEEFPTAVEEPSAALEEPIPAVEESPDTLEEPVSAVEASPEAALPAGLSQVDIDTIARKVAAEISEKVVRDLVPQITDLIVKRISEERLKE